MIETALAHWARTGHSGPAPGALRAPGNRGVDQGAGLGCVHREAAEGATLVLGGDRRQHSEVRAPAPRRRVPIAGRSKCRPLSGGPVQARHAHDVSIRTGWRSAAVSCVISLRSAFSALT